MQLSAKLVVALVAIGSVHSTSSADGTLTMRGVYYKERSTRVVQPMLDGMFEVGLRGLFTGHLLVDAITSASASSGAAAAAAFTERRFEGGAGYAQEFDGPEDSILDVFRLGASTRVSREPDYRSLYATVLAFRNHRFLSNSLLFFVVVATFVQLVAGARDPAPREAAADEGWSGDSLPEGAPAA